VGRLRSASARRPEAAVADPLKGFGGFGEELIYANRDYWRWPKMPASIDEDTAMLSITFPVRLERDEAAVVSRRVPERIPVVVQSIQ